MSCCIQKTLCNNGVFIEAALVDGVVVHYTLPELQPYTGSLDGFEPCEAVNTAEPVEDECFFIAGTARNSPDGWFWIDDATHKPKGIDVNNIDVIPANGGMLRINYSQTASQIGSLVVGPDEALARLNISLGASVTTSQALINFGDELGNVIPADQVTSSGNIWVMGIMWR